MYWSRRKCVYQTFGLTKRVRSVSVSANPDENQLITKNGFTNIWDEITCLEISELKSPDGSVLIEMIRRISAAVLVKTIIVNLYVYINSYYQTIFIKYFYMILFIY